ncbi:aprataxin and PNK-like factor isoform X2 [Talpa occidentalis]|uniref:aprataxin and PNK-like factor isoform X2 n=1 Tax=Talpa occidentalis TaxID=50954 RepID=UPI00188E8124|nr:aprataxin and PNK-like factor isoform X2 [Talpa occidentalis]
MEEKEGSKDPKVLRPSNWITDKRVSRRHAILEVVGGQLRIKPIHTNPCFYQSSEKSQLLPLKTNLWHWLNPGDRFSLLVDKYIFCVFSTYSETEMEYTLRNSQMLDEDDILNETPKSSLMNLPDETMGAPQWERSPEIAETQTAMENSVSFLGKCTNFSKQQPNPGQRKRILPTWMLTENVSDQNLPVPVISEDNNIQESGKMGICKNKTQGNITQQRRKRLISSESSEGTSAEQDTGKKCRDADQEESVISSKEIPQSFSATTLSYTQMNNIKSDTRRNKISKEEPGKISEHKIITQGRQDEEDEAINCFERCLSAQSRSLHEAQGSHPESSSNPSNPETLYAGRTDSVPQGSEENKVKRTSCMYGANCYRKNPVHFQHFSHPGDSDYGSMQVTCQDEADDQPECPYGASCYRKNPQHKIEYRHSTLPVSNTSDEDNDNVGQPNEYNLNDSFLDDEEEEYEPTDEDSDWEPGKEDQEKEDVEELLKEAKKFMKRKK